MILRDKSSITKMLIMLELVQGRRKLKEIAKNIDITVQGVSEYLKILERDGFVKDGTITIKGWEFLSGSLDELGDFLHGAMRVINRASVTEAIAGEDIPAGSKVGLFLENGYIYAYLKTSPSSGTAIHSARKGEDLGVTDLRGVLQVNYGNIIVYSLPSIEEGGTRKIKAKELRKIIERYEDYKIGTCGVVAYLSVKAVHDVDFEYSAVNAAVDAYYRGISTILFASHERVPNLLDVLEKKGVKYTLKSLE